MKDLCLGYHFLHSMTKVFYYNAFYIHKRIGVSSSILVVFWPPVASCLIMILSLTESINMHIGFRVYYKFLPLLEPSPLLTAQKSPEETPPEDSMRFVFDSLLYAPLLSPHEHRYPVVIVSSQAALSVMVSSQEGFVTTVSSYAARSTTTFTPVCTCCAE